MMDLSRKIFVYLGWMNAEIVGTVLYCTVLYCIMLHCTVQYCTQYHPKSCINNICCTRLDLTIHETDMSMVNNGDWYEFIQTGAEYDQIIIISGGQDKHKLIRIYLQQNHYKGWLN